MLGVIDHDVECSQVGFSLFIQNAALGDIEFGKWLISVGAKYEERMPVCDVTLRL